jgi:hypothetical protein
LRERAKENGGDQRNWDRVLDDWDQDREIWCHDGRFSQVCTSLP